VRTPDHEVSDLTAALRHLYQHPEDRTCRGEAAVHYVSKHHAMRSVVERYAAMIELTAAHREAEDVLWSELACDALGASADPVEVETLLEPWAALRLRAQETMRVVLNAERAHRHVVSPSFRVTASAHTP